MGGVTFHRNYQCLYSHFFHNARCLVTGLVTVLELLKAFLLLNNIHFFTHLMSSELLQDWWCYNFGS